MRRSCLTGRTLAVFTLLQAVLFLPAESALSTCKSLATCPDGVCTHTVNFTSPLANATLTTGLTGVIETGAYGVPQQCSLYQRMPVCLGNAQQLDVRFVSESFSKSNGTNCTLQDVSVVMDVNDYYVVHANMIAPPCFLSNSGCDCTSMKKANWGQYDILPLSDENGRPNNWATRTACTRKKRSVKAHVIFALTCPLPRGEWVSADVALTFRPNPAYCDPKRISPGARDIYVCFYVMGAVAALGTVLLLIAGIAKLLMRSAISPGVTHAASGVSGCLGHLFDINGVLHMDMAEGRDRFFTLTVMVSVVLGIAIVVFPPKLKSDDNVKFGQPNAKLSDLNLDRIMQTLSTNKDAITFYRSLLRPLLTLALSACFGLWAYLILLINFTTPPPWTRQGRAENPNAAITPVWRAKYVCKKVVAGLALLLLDFIAWRFVTVQIEQQYRWMFQLPNWWITFTICIAYVAMHLKFIEVVFMELSNGGVCSCCCCCCCFMKSVKSRYYPSPPIEYLSSSIPRAQPVGMPNTTISPTKTSSFSSPSKTNTSTKDDTTEDNTTKNNTTKANTTAVKTEPAEQHESGGFLDKIKSFWDDARSSKEFRYTGWFLAAVAVSVVLAIYYFLLNIEMIGEFAECLALDSPCVTSIERNWMPMILSGVSALLNRGNTEASLTRLVNTWLGAKLENVMVEAGLEGATAFAQNVTNNSSPIYSLYKAVQTCDSERLNLLLQPAAMEIANSTLSGSNDTAIAIAEQFGFNVPALIQPLLVEQIEPIWRAACPQASTIFNQTSRFFNQAGGAKNIVLKQIDKVQTYLNTFKRALRVGGYVGSSIGFIVAMVSLFTIMHVYKKALVKIHMGRLKTMVVLEESTMKHDNKAVELFVLTEAARDAQPLRAVFFYGVIFSSVLLQMQLATVIFTLLIMLFQIPGFWSVIMVQVAAYLVTMLVGIMISAIVVTSLGSTLAPNGRISSPSGWLVYYIIFSCAYIVLGIFIAVARLVFVLLTSLLFLVRIDKCINLIGNQLDPAYMSFLGMMRMHFELRGSAVRNRRYHGAWGKVRRVVYERRDLLQNELKRREAREAKYKESKEVDV